MRRLWLLTVLLSAISASAQSQKIGDFIESTSYNLDKIGVERQQQYQPRHGSFVCENGTNAEFAAGIAIASGYMNVYYSKMWLTIEKSIQ